MCFVAVFGAGCAAFSNGGQMVFTDVIIDFDSNVQIQTLTVSTGLCPSRNTEEGILRDGDRTVVDLACIAVGAGASIVGGIVDYHVICAGISQNQLGSLFNLCIVVQICCRLLGSSGTQRGYTGVHFCANNAGIKDHSVVAGGNTLDREDRSAVCITDSTFGHLQCAANFLSGSHSDACHGLAVGIQNLHHNLLRLCNIGYITVGVGMRQAADQLVYFHRIADVIAGKGISCVILRRFINGNNNAVSAECFAVRAGQLHDTAIIHACIGGAHFRVVKCDCHGNCLTVLCYRHKTTCDLRNIHILTEYHADLIRCHTNRNDRGSSGGYQTDVHIQLRRRHGEPAVHSSGIIAAVGIQIAVLSDLHQPVSDGSHPSEAAIHIGDLGVHFAVQVGICPVDHFAVFALVIDLCGGALDTVRSYGLIDVTGGVNDGIGANGILRLFLVRRSADTQTMVGIIVFFLFVPAAIGIFIGVLLLFAILLLFEGQRIQTGGIQIGIQLVDVIQIAVEHIHANAFADGTHQADGCAGQHGLRALGKPAHRRRGNIGAQSYVLGDQPVAVPILGLHTRNGEFLIDLATFFQSFLSSLRICQTLGQGLTIHSAVGFIGTVLSTFDPL